MMFRKLSNGFASVVAGVLVSGVASLPGAHAQDAQQPPAGYPPAGPAGYPSAGPTDPNSPNAPPSVDANAPPGAYLAPPPGGAPQYMPAVQQPAPPPRNPWLAMAFIGVHSFQGDNFATGPGLRIGGIGGLRVNDQLSFNGEIVYDLVNPNASLSGVSIYNFQIAAAPFYHLQASPTAEVVIGPKVGFYRFAASGSDYYGSIDSGDNGLVLGANVGAFVRLSPLVAIGGMLSFDYEKPLSCSTNSAYDSYASGCDTSMEPAPKMISAAAGALF
jgi:hypothetical protein